MPQWFRQCTYCNMHSVQTVICHNDYDCVQIVVCHIMCFTFGSVPDMCKNDQFCQCYVRVKQKCWRHWMAKPWLTSACNFWTVWSISKVRSHVHTHTARECQTSTKWPSTLSMISRIVIDLGKCYLISVDKNMKRITLSLQFIVA